MGDFAHSKGHSQLTMFRPMFLLTRALAQTGERRYSYTATVLQPYRANVNIFSVLRGTIVNRTYGTDKKQYISLF